MKKLVVLLVAVLMLTSCGEKQAANTVVCSGKVEEAGEKYEAKVTGYLKDNKIETVDATMVFEKEKTAKAMCDLYSLVNNMIEKEEEKINITCDGKNVTIKGFEKLDSVESDDKGLTTLTKEEFVKYFTEENDDLKLTCK